MSATTPSFDPLALVVRTAPSRRARATVGAEVGFEVDPDVAYPAVIAELDRLAAAWPDVPDALAERVMAWRALRAGFTEAQRGEFARLTLTAMLKAAVGGPIGVRILNRPRWRL